MLNNCFNPIRRYSACVVFHFRRLFFKTDLYAFDTVQRPDDVDYLNQAIRAAHPSYIENSFSHGENLHFFPDQKGLPAR
jgi:hypothetical protein